MSAFLRWQTKSFKFQISQAVCEEENWNCRVKIAQSELIIYVFFIKYSFNDRIMIPSIETTKMVNNITCIFYVVSVIFMNVNLYSIVLPRVSSVLLQNGKIHAICSIETKSSFLIEVFIQNGNISKNCSLQHFCNAINKNCLNFIHFEICFRNFICILHKTKSQISWRIQFSNISYQLHYSDNCFNFFRIFFCVLTAF